MQFVQIYKMRTFSIFGRNGGSKGSPTIVHNDVRRSLFEISAFVLQLGSRDAYLMLLKDHGHKMGREFYSQLYQLECYLDILSARMGL